MSDVRNLFLFRLLARIRSFGPLTVYSRISTVEVSMRRGLILLLFLLGTVLTGCSETKEPEPEYIPDIPPGRGAAESDGSGSQNGSMPAPPQRGQPER